MRKNCAVASSAIFAQSIFVRALFPFNNYGPTGIRCLQEIAGDQSDPKGSSFHEGGALAGL